jgi:hypothetical protein
MFVSKLSIIQHLHYLNILVKRKLETMHAKK